MEKLDKSDGQSMDIVADNIAKLKELFPEILTENKIDFTTLKALLGEEVETDDERYSFNWHGKAQARQLAQSPSTGTLRPCKEDSVDWDATQNLFIEGDNLEVLKLLQKSYHKRVKIIYIDPPYNTGKDFVYPDNFRDNIHNYLEITGQKDGGNKITTNTEASGRYHTDWLNMMYPRLKLARNLLSDDGVIFVSIDNTEAANIRKLMDDVFGEECFVETVVAVRSENGMGGKEGFATNHEYIFCYKKDKSSEAFYDLTPTQEFIAKFDKQDQYGKYKVDGIFRKKGDGQRREDSPGCFYPVYYNPVTGEVSLEKRSDFKETFPKLPNGKDGRWVWSPEFAKDKMHRLYSGREGTIYIKDYFAKDTREKPKSVLRNSSILTDRATTEIKELFSEKVFQTVKPVGLINILIDIASKENHIILDFFAGSGTTGHATMLQNSTHKSNRKYILVQLPEPINSGVKEQKVAFDFCEEIQKPHNICEITKERLRRAAKKIQTENPQNNSDLGFKVFKLDSSNLKPWDADFDSLAQDLAEATEVVKAERGAEDVLFEILLKYGLDLTLPIATHTLEGKTVYEVGAGALVVCLDSGITEAVAEAIGKLKETLEPEVMRVVFKDSSFANDAAKVNAVQVLKQFGIDDVKSI